MVAAGVSGSVVSMICDSGERYGHTYYDDDWLARNGFDLAPWCRLLDEFCATGRLPRI